MKNVTLWEQIQNPIEKIYDRSQIHVPGLVQAFQ